MSSDQLDYELSDEIHELDRTTVYDSQHFNAPMDLGLIATTSQTFKRKVDELGDTNDDDQKYQEQVTIDNGISMVNRCMYTSRALVSTSPLRVKNV